jgi:hypothetical protein
LKEKKYNIAAQPKTQIKSIFYLTNKYSGFLFGSFVSAILIQLSEIFEKKLKFWNFLCFFFQTKIQLF